MVGVSVWFVMSIDNLRLIIWQALHNMNNSMLLINVCTWKSINILYEYQRPFWISKTVKNLIMSMNHWWKIQLTFIGIKTMASSKLYMTQTGWSVIRINEFEICTIWCAVDFHFVIFQHHGTWEWSRNHSEVLRGVIFQGLPRPRGYEGLWNGQSNVVHCISSLSP